jgi:uncharacterized protein YndB with AHSA1/START domain
MELVLQLRRELPASREAVYAAFVDAQHVAQWWGPEGFSIPSIDFEPRAGAGAAYRIEMQPPEGGAFFLSGEFREVDPPARLAFTFNWDPPDPDDVETLVDLSFGDAIELRQGEFRTEERLELHRAGWGDSFDKLERYLRS